MRAVIAHLKTPGLKEFQKNNLGRAGQFSIKQYEVFEGHDIVVPED
jgi:hypothetical protein